MPSYKELLAQRESLERQIEEAKSREYAEVLNEIKQKMADYGITLAELSGGRGGKALKNAGRPRAGEGRRLSFATIATRLAVGMSPVHRAGLRNVLDSGSLALTTRSPKIAHRASYMKRRLVGIPKTWLWPAVWPRTDAKPWRKSSHSTK